MKYYFIFAGIFLAVFAFSLFAGILCGAVLFTESMTGPALIGSFVGLLLATIGTGGAGLCDPSS